MAKRGPQSSLNHLNWNEMEEPEEKGEFAKASDDILKHRVIKKARRRVATDAADSTAPAASTSVFGAFKGFASTPVAKSVDRPDGAPTFSFLSSLGAGAAKTNGNGTATVSSSGSDSNAAGSTKPMFSFGSNLGTIATADANKKMFTFGSANALKADSTEGAKNASSTSSGFGISSSKDGEKDSGKGLFSFTNTAASAGTMPAFSFSSVPPKATDSPKPEKNFTFGSPIGNKNAESDTTAKPTFSFGSIAAKTGSGEADKKMPTFGSPIAAKDTSLNAASSTGMFNFGSNAAKSDTGGDSEKKTFTFGSSPAAAKETINSLGKGTFSFGSVAAKSDSSETEKKTFAFGGSPAATKEPADAAPPTKSMFSFGSNAAKPTAPIEIPKRATVTFGSPAGMKDMASAKGAFSFGSIPPKSNADEGAVKKGAYSFGYVSTGAKDTAVTPPKETFSFGLSQPTNSNTVGTPTKPAESEKKTFSFGVTSPSNETAADKRKEAATFAAPKENSDDTIKKMFSFASSTATPKAVDTGKKDEENRPVSASFASTTKPAVTGVEKTLCVKSNVIALNKAFIAWITEKTKENAYCSLLPVFKSYETYFEEITKTEQSCTAETKTTTTAEAAKQLFAMSKPDDAPTAATSEQTNALANKPTTDQVSKEPEKPKEKTGFFFGTSAAKESPTTAKPVAPAAAAAPTGFMFGGTAKPLTFGAFSTAGNTTNITATTNNLSSVSTTSPSFFAGASTFASKALSPGGFTFGGVVKPPVPDSSAANDKDSAGGGDGGEADEDEPPKVEFTPVEEKDSLYSKRCKLFIKADGSYSDRGVGTLHVKMVDGKVQVLVRADTSLGNILLNIILNESVPLQRLGKNNVMMICLPTPDAKPPPTSVLLRVKTTEEADELYESLLKYKPK
ncbi:nuclear pore complex protein Nup50 [Anopheles marshallii]|uniref:nuclear pore complex protein Nup50 n=1 Tax=Anopheles marshallii TaxID=1521116 RepID=UPI00237A2D8B|nr:nuclear pore complex protein Nup50 [Anopheles marshallii]